MTATLVRANCKLLSIGNSDSVPLVALLAKNLLIHFFLVISHCIIRIHPPKDYHYEN